MSKSYTEKEMKELYKKIKPTKIDEIEMAIKTKGIEALYPFLNEIKNETNDIKSRLTRIEITLGLEEIPVNVLEVKDIIDKVSDYLKNNKEAYPSEIADFLGISIKDVMKSIQILKHQKKIEVIE